MKERGIPFSASMVCALREGLKSQTRRVLFPQPDPCNHAPWPNERTKWVHDADGWHCGVCGNGVELARRKSGVKGITCPYGVEGDRLWVREAWRVPQSLDEMDAKGIAEAASVAGYDKPWAPIRYEADGALSSQEEWRTFGNGHQLAVPGRYRHGRFMPRWASRISLDVTGIRIERLQDISEADALAEGVERARAVDGEPVLYRDYAMGEKRDVAEWFSSPVDSYRTLWEAINGKGSWNNNPWVWAVAAKRAWA
jgi:hypothetical protein